MRDANGQTEIEVSWKAPTTGGTATSYRIDVSKDSYSWIALEADWRQGTTYTHMGLKPGSTRYYRVFAKNVAGTGRVAESPNYDFASTAGANAPDPVLQLRTTKVGHNQIDLAWSMPASAGGKTIKRYCIEAEPTDVDGAVDLADVPLANMECEADSLISNLGTEADQINQDNGTFEMDGGFIVLGRSTFTLSHKNLDAGDTWTYRAFSASDQGTSAVASNVLAVTTPAATKPGKPTDLRNVPVENGGGEALYWNWPASDGGADIRNFIVEQSLDKGKTWTQSGQRNHGPGG